MGRNGTAPEQDESTSFYLMITGQIESGNFGAANNLYCKFSFTQGNDWTVVVGNSGVTGGLSQIAQRGATGFGIVDDGSVIWNFPIDVVYKATNAYGWPRIAITVYGVDALGRDVAYGYGSVMVPTQPGQYEREVEMYAPMPASMVQRIMNSVRGTHPEYFDSNFVAQGSNREVTRVQATGSVKLSLHVATKDMLRFGYVPTATPLGNGLNFSTNTLDGPRSMGRQDSM